VPANPNVPLGSLNKLKASLKFTSNASLNILPSYMSQAGLTIGFEGQATSYSEVYVGVVPSPNPFILVTIRFGVLKTQVLGPLWKAQVESNTLIGDFVLRPDVQGFPSFDFTNGFIMNPDEIAMNGTSAMFGISLRATYQINSSLWP
jgi:hypothetical protein